MNPGITEIACIWSRIGSKFRTALMIHRSLSPLILERPGQYLLYIFLSLSGIEFFSTGSLPFRMASDHLFTNIWSGWSQLLGRFPIIGQQEIGPSTRRHSGEELRWPVTEASMASTSVKSCFGDRPLPFSSYRSLVHSARHSSSYTSWRKPQILLCEHDCWHPSLYFLVTHLPIIRETCRSVVSVVCVWSTRSITTGRSSRGACAEKQLSKPTWSVKEDVWVWPNSGAESVTGSWATTWRCFPLNSASRQGFLQFLEKSTCVCGGGGGTFLSKLQIYSTSILRIKQVLYKTFFFK